MKKAKADNWNSPGRYPLYSAILTAILFLLMLVFNAIPGYGNKTILSGDLYDRYISFISMFVKLLKGKGSFYYSFSLYFGSSASATYAYYCLSPFNLLYLIPGISMSAMTIVVITAKLSLAAASFQSFLYHGIKAHRADTILFAVSYALCTFAVTMHMQLMWLDTLYILPLIILLLIRFTEGSSPLPLIPAYALLFITNFYMGYIAGIFSAICFISLIILNLDKLSKASLIHVLKKCLIYAAVVLLAAACCAAVLLPAAYELFAARGEAAPVFSPVPVSLTDVLNNLFMGEMQSISSPVPLIYCGLPALLLLPVYYYSPAIRRREKLCTAVIFIFYLAGSQFSPVYSFLHAFCAPDGYAHRYAFCVVFLILALACRAVSDIDSFSQKALWYYAAGLMIFYAILIPVQRLTIGGYHTNSHGWLILNMIFLLVYLILLTLRKRGIQARVLFPALCATLLVELLINGSSCLGRNSSPYKSEVELTAWSSTEDNFASELLAADPSFYRLRVLNESNLNAPSFFGYAGLNSSAATDNTLLRETLTSLGIGNSGAMIYDQGYTGITDMLFDVKYTLDPEEKTIEGSPLALPVGFMCNTDLLAWRPAGDVFSNQESLVSSMSGSKYRFYTPLSVSGDDLQTRNMDILSFEDTLLFQHQSDMAINGKVVFSFPEYKHSLILGHFTPKSSPALDNSAPAIDCYTGGFGKPARLSDGSIFILPHDEEDIPIATINFTESGSYDYAVKDMLFTAYDDSSLIALQKDLGAYPFIVDSYRDGYISGSVTATEDRPVLFTSIPYERGWKAYVDGIESPVGVSVNGSFLSLAVTPGTHELQLVYEHPYASLSIILSGIGILIFLVLLLCRQRSLKQTHADEEDR